MPTNISTQFEYTQVLCFPIDVLRISVTMEPEVKAELNEDFGETVYDDLDIVAAMENAGWEYIDTIVTRYSQEPGSCWIDRRNWRIRFKRTR